MRSLYKIKKRRFVDNQSFFKSLIATLPKWIHQFQKSKHENILYTNPDYLFQLLWFLKYHTNTHFQFLIDICGVDHPSQKRKFEVIYNLLSIHYNSRICVQSNVDKITPICSIVSIFPSASWWE
ncbi:hypothetical protein CY35_03G105300 [Sphagnum magellanicum]|nr:hypothetical protein CY35_03G105300 [Sphagnum magellanicum]